MYFRVKEGDEYEAEVKNLVSSQISGVYVCRDKTFD